MSYRKITVSDNTYIGPLQMFGPIIHPINVPDKIVIDLVRRGYTVNEKLKNGSVVKLDLYTAKNPNGVTSTPVVEAANKPVPKVEPVVQKVVEEVKPAVVEMPETIDDNVRDYGESVEQINTLPAVNVAPPTVHEVPVTPEDRGLTIVGVVPEDEHDEVTETLPVPVEEDTEDESSDTTDETVTDSNNQARKNKKKKRR